MIRISSENDSNLVYLKTIGKLTHSDFKKIIPSFEQKLEAFKKLNIFVDLIELEGWEWRAAWDDFAFGIKYWKNLKKISILGDKRWIKLSVTVSDKLMPAGVRFFDIYKKKEALDWLKC
jgi:hypothetical protein